MTTTQRIGQHIVRIEDDIVFVATKGEMKLAELQTLLTIFEEALQRHPQTYGMFDVADSVPFGPELRKHYNQWAIRWQFAGIAFYGASLMVRTVVGMKQYRYTRALDASPRSIRPDRVDPA